MMQVKQAMILAAGRGERMRPITDSRPKPLVEVAGRSLIDRQMDRVEAYGITDVVVNTSYLGAMLQAHLRTRPTPHIRFSEEATPLETGGGVLKALPLLGQDPFFVMNSDVIICDAVQQTALQRLAAHWNDASMDALLLLHPRQKAIGYDGAGDFFLESDGLTLCRRGQRPEADYVFTGTQLLHPRLFKDAPEGAFSMNVLYDRSRNEAGVLSRIKGVVHTGDWLHVGEPAAIAQAEAFLALP
jgi:MurNAc alpha-1-phosphate uridylyltransferase